MNDLVYGHDLGMGRNELLSVNQLNVRECEDERVGQNAKQK